jgi:hypothetical protein
MSTFTAQVNAGIKLLDEQQPGWRDKIDLETLNLGSCSVCVLGQIFGDYEEGTIELDIEDDPYQYGFNALNGGMEQLTQAWKDALGKDKVIVEKGDVYHDSGQCCAVKVLGTELVHTGTEMITVYLVQHGYVSGDEFKSSGQAKNSLGLLLKSNFEQGTGTYTKKLVKFTFKKGQFVTNDTGKVYYVVNPEVAREVADQKWAVNTDEIDRKGLREVTLPGGGMKFSDTVK